MSALRSSLVVSALRASLTLVALLLLGCGGGGTHDDGGTTGDGPSADADHDGGTTGDGGSDGGGAFTVTLSATPRRAVYANGEAVTIDAVVRDAAGATISGATLAWTVDPPTAATGAVDSYVLAAEGTVTFEACIVPGAGLPTGECGSLALVVDDPPHLVVTSPAAGAELGDDGSTAIHVAGTVDDPSATVTVGGVATTVGASGAFAADVPASFGVHHVEVVATDTIGASATVERDVLWAEHYATVTDVGAGRSSRTAVGALRATLRTIAIDDGTPHTAAAATSLAGGLALVTEGLDPMTHLARPLSSSASMTLDVTAVRLTGAHVTLSTSATGFDAVVTIGRVEADTTGTLTISGTPVSLDGTISFDCTVTLAMSASATGGAVFVVADSSSTAVTTASSAFVDTNADAIFALPSGVLRTTLMTRVPQAVTDAVVEATPALLEAALRNWTIGAGESRVVGTTNIDVATHLSSFGVTAGGPVTALLDVDAVAPAGTRASRGAPTPDAAPAEAPGGSAETRSELAPLEHRLHAAWSAGWLEGTSVDLTGGVTATTHAALTPVVTWEGGGAARLVASIGELELTASDGARWGVSVSAPVELSATATGIVATPGTPTVRAWVLAAAPGAPAPAMVADLFTLDAWPSISAALATLLGTTARVPDFGDVTAYAPALTSLTTALASPGVERRGDALVCTATIAAAL